MKTDLKDWLDSDGFLHLDLRPEINSTTNGALFTGTYIVLKYRANFLNISDVHDFVETLKNIYEEDVGVWRNHSKSEWDEFSLDNFTGIATALVCCKKWLERKNFQKSEVYHQCEFYLNSIPYFHHQLDHPKDFIYLGFLKCWWLFVWFMWIPSLAMIVSCTETYKEKDDKLIVKTDGKILAFLRFTAVGMPITEYICTKLIKQKVHEGKWTYGKWKEVFHRYYKTIRHPNRKLMEILDE